MLLCLELGCLAAEPTPPCVMLLRVNRVGRWGRHMVETPSQCHGPHWYQQQAHVLGISRRVSGACCARKFKQLAAAAGRGPADVAARVARRRRPAPVAAAAALRRGLGRALLVAGALGARRRPRRGGRRHVRGRLPRGLLRRLRRAGGGAPGLLKKVVEQPPTPPLFGLAHTRF